MNEFPFQISVRPFHIKRHGICGVRIKNQGAATTTFTLSGQANDKHIQFEVMPAQVTIPQGQKGAVCVRVKRKRQFLGFHRKINFTIRVQSSDGVQQIVPGYLEYAPLLAFWQLALLFLVTVGFCLI